MKNIKNTNLILAVVLIILAAGAGFVGGMQYQKNQIPSFGSGQFGSRAAGGAFAGRSGNAQGTRPVTGQIVSVDSNSMTVKMQDGSTKIVILSSSTSINKAAQGSKSDLKVGVNVAAFGTANSDGSITAQSIQLNPTMRGFTGGGRPQQTP